VRYSQGMRAVTKTSIQLVLKGEKAVCWMMTGPDGGQAHRRDHDGGRESTGRTGGGGGQAHAKLKCMYRRESGLVEDSGFAPDAKESGFFYLLGGVHHGGWTVKSRDTTKLSKPLCRPSQRVREQKSAARNQCRSAP